LLKAPLDRPIVLPGDSFAELWGVSQWVIS